MLYRPRDKGQGEESDASSARIQLDKLSFKINRNLSEPGSMDSTLTLVRQASLTPMMGHKSVDDFRLVPIYQRYRLAPSS